MESSSRKRNVLRRQNSIDKDSHQGVRMKEKKKVTVARPG
jgi:hypothetical protein